MTNSAQQQTTLYIGVYFRASTGPVTYRSDGWGIMQPITEADVEKMVKAKTNAEEAAKDREGLRARILAGQWVHPDGDVFTLRA